MARTLMAGLPQRFELVLRKIPGCRFRIIKGDFLFYKLEMVYCVFSLESPRRGDSNDNTQYTFILKKSKIYPYSPPDLRL